VPTLLSREALGLPRTGELLLLPQSLFKIHPDNDRLVAAILAGRPGAKLVLFTGRHESITLAYRQRLERALAEHDAGGAERLVFLPYVPRDRYLQINLACDLMLDTQHWSGGNTSLDALACALPVVTLPGRFMRGRQSAAMLEIAGVPELIVESAEAYVSLALRLLEDRDFQQTVRGRLVGGAGRLFDDPAPLRALAEFLQSAVAADRARSA
jgi:CRISPR-associated protein Csy1